MEMQQSLRMRFSFRNATIVICSFNIIAALFLLHSFFSSSVSSRSAQYGIQSNSAVLRHIKECEEMRLAMQPMELIKRVREIEQEAYAEPKAVLQKGIKQTAALDLSKRLKDFRSFNDATNMKALEEWRKRKMERARQRQMEKKGILARQ